MLDAFGHFNLWKHAVFPAPLASAAAFQLWHWASGAAQNDYERQQGKGREQSPGPGWPMVTMGERLTCQDGGLQNIRLVWVALTNFLWMFPGKLDLQTRWDGGNPEGFSLPKVLSFDRSSSKNPFASYHGWESACRIRPKFSCFCVDVFMWAKCLSLYLQQELSCLNLVPITASWVLDL